MFKTGSAVFAINYCYARLRTHEDSRVPYFSQTENSDQQLKSVMALETLSSNEFSNFIIYDTISATPFSSHDSSEASFLLEENRVKYHEHDPAFTNNALGTRKRQSDEPETIGQRHNFAVQGRKKRKRKPRVCKNKEEAEAQRMTHITVERNRRKQMNEHLAVLHSLMPESYVQRVCHFSFHLSFFFSLSLSFLSHKNVLGSFHNDARKYVMVPNSKAVEILFFRKLLSSTKLKWYKHIQNIMRINSELNPKAMLSCAQDNVLLCWIFISFEYEKETILSLQCNALNVVPNNLKFENSACFQIAYFGPLEKLHI